MRWLRDAARRSTPMWLRLLVVVLIVASFVPVRIAFPTMSLGQAALIGAVIGAIIAVVAKLIWAVATAERGPDER